MLGRGALHDFIDSRWMLRQVCSVLFLQNMVATLEERSVMTTVLTGCVTSYAEGEIGAAPVVMGISLTV